MRLQTVALGVRLIAIWLALAAAQQGIIALAESMAGSEIEGQRLSMVLWAAVPGVLALVLWLFAPAVASLLLRGLAEASAEAGRGSPSPLDSLLQAGVIVLGIWLAAEGLVGLVRSGTNIGLALALDTGLRIFMADFLSSILRFSLGFALMLKGQRLLAWLPGAHGNS